MKETKYINKKNDNLIIKIENTGKKLEEDLSVLIKKGNGLNNILERLKTLYQENYKLSIRNNFDKVVTKITIPFQLSISKITQEY